MAGKLGDAASFTKALFEREEAAMDLSQVTLTQLRYAVAVADTRSFRRAAERCFVSQPGLSMQLSKLEDCLGVRLFDRGKTPILQTPEGEIALAQMRRILTETERLGQSLADDGVLRGSYRLAVIPTLAGTVLPLFLARFCAEFPEVELKIEERKTQDIIERLSVDQLDGAILSTPIEVPGFTEHVLGRERLLAYLSPRDPLLKKKHVTQKELAERPLWLLAEGHCFRSQVLAVCSADPRLAQHGSALGVAFESGSFETLARLVDQGLGATVVPELFARGLPSDRRRRQVRSFSGHEPVREIGFVTTRQVLRSKISQGLVAAIRSALKSSLATPPRSRTVPPEVGVLGSLSSSRRPARVGGP